MSCTTWMGVRALSTHKRIKLTIWLKLVAHAAPATPIRKPKMSTGSSTTLSTAPAVMPSIETDALP